MSATFAFGEDNGAVTGSPSKGTTRTTPTNVNWKNIGDSTSSYSDYPITVPAASSNYSFPKYQFGIFSGTFTQISAGKWSAHTDANSFPTGVTLKGTVTSTYAEPAATNSAFGTDFSTTVAIGSGSAVLFSTTGPEGGSTAATLSAAGYTQYLATQLVVASTCSTPGDTAAITQTLSYNEN